MRILLVEDNKTLAEWLRRTLNKEQYVVDAIENGLEADLVLRAESFDLIILDLGLPGMDGKEVLRRLRARGNRTPVLVLTADNTTASLVSELNHGADDYVAKPFEVEELEARIRVLLRRSSNVASPLVECGSLSFDTNSRAFSLAGQPLALPRREHAVLESLIIRAGTTMSKAVLCQRLATMDVEVSPEAVEIYVHRVRKKLENSDVAIVTLRGLGYLLRSVERDLR
ncbi:MAG: response regulator [Burkholderiaceae bacterium]